MATNIITNDTSIVDFTKTVYYINNTNKKIFITLGTPKFKTALQFYLMDPDGYECAIFLTKGLYFIHPSNPSLHLIYDGKWKGIGTTPVPFQEDQEKQILSINLFENAHTSTDFLILQGYTGVNTGVDGKLKIDKDLILMNSPNFQSTNIDQNDGVGAIIIYQILNSNLFKFHSILSGTYKIQTNQKQGNFSTHLRVLPMDQYDLVVVSAPSIYKIFIYSYRKNAFDEFYFQKELDLPFSSSFNLLDLQTITDKGLLLYTNQFYIYDVSNNQTQIFSSLDLSQNPTHFQTYQNQLWINDSTKIYRFDLSLNETNVIANRTASISVPNIKHMLIRDQRIFLATLRSIRAYDLSGNPIYTQSTDFSSDILSFDVFGDRILVLVHSNIINVYLMNNNEILMSDYLTQDDDPPTKVRFDTNGQTFYLSFPDASVIDENHGNMNQIGYLVRYDLYLDSSSQTLTNFPSFNITNQLLLEESNTSKQVLQSWKEMVIQEKQIPLISNIANSSKTVSKIYPVWNDQGIMLEIIPSEIEWMSESSPPISKYFIYSDVSTNLINEQTKYISVSATQMLSYNSYILNQKKLENFTFVKTDSNLYLFMLGSGQDSTWSLTRIDTNNTLTVIDSSGTGSIRPTYFTSRVIETNIFFLIATDLTINLLKYDLISSSITLRKSLTRNSENSTIMVDHIGNVIDYTGSMITVYPLSAQYNATINYPHTFTLSSKNQILIEYKNRNLFVLQNEVDDDQSNTQYFSFNVDLSTNVLNPTSISIQISNTNATAIQVLDFVVDPSSTFVVCNLEDISRIFYHPQTKKVYKFAKILNTQFNQYETISQDMLMSKEKQILNSFSYKINDLEPLQFYHEYYSQFFNGKNILQLLGHLNFYDNRVLVEKVESNLNIIHRKGGDANGAGGTLRKIVIAPDSDKVIKNYSLNMDHKRVAVIENSKIGKYGCMKIFDLSGIENKIYQKDFSGNEICSDTLLELNNHSYYLLERDISGETNLYKLWRISDSSQNMITIQSDFSGCIYANPYFDHFFLDQVQDGKIIVWKYYNQRIVINFVPTDLTNKISFTFDHHLIHIQDQDKLYLFIN